MWWASESNKYNQTGLAQMISEDEVEPVLGRLMSLSRLMTVLLAAWTLCCYVRVYTRQIDLRLRL